MRPTGIPPDPEVPRLSGNSHTIDSNADGELLLDFSDAIGSIDAEMGALSVALHPEFGLDGSPNSGFVYLWYTSFFDGEQRNHLARFDLSPDYSPGP